MIPSVIHFPRAPFLELRSGKRKPNYTLAHIGWVETLIRRFYPQIEIRHDLSDSDAYPSDYGVACLLVDYPDTSQIWTAVDFDDRADSVDWRSLRACRRYLAFHLTEEALGKVPRERAERVSVIGPCMGQTPDEQSWFIENYRRLRAPLISPLPAKAILCPTRMFGEDAPRRVEFYGRAFEAAMRENWMVDWTQVNYYTHLSRHERFRAVLDCIGEKPFTPARKVVQALALGVPVISNGQYWRGTLLPGKAVKTLTWAALQDFCGPIAYVGSSGGSEDIQIVLGQMSHTENFLDMRRKAIEAYDQWFNPSQIAAIIVGEECDQ